MDWIPIHTHRTHMHKHAEIKRRENETRVDRWRDGKKWRKKRKKMYLQTTNGIATRCRSFYICTTHLHLRACVWVSVYACDVINCTGLSVCITLAWLLSTESVLNGNVHYNNPSRKDDNNSSNNINNRSKTNSSEKKSETVDVRAKCFVILGCCRGLLLLLLFVYFSSIIIIIIKIVEPIPICPHTLTNNARERETKTSSLWIILKKQISVYAFDHISSMLLYTFFK